MAHDVFISYSSKDKAIADGVCAALEATRIRCWIAPRDILAGRTFAEAIAEAIAASCAMVLIYSRNSSISGDVLRELTLAVTSNVVVIPFRIEEAPLEGAMKYYLSGTHWLDAMNPPTERQIQQLVATIRPFVARDTLSAADEAQNPGDVGVKIAHSSPQKNPVSAESASTPKVPTRSGVLSVGVLAHVPRLATIPVVALVLLVAAWILWGNGEQGSPSITGMTPLGSVTTRELDRKPTAQAAVVSGASAATATATATRVALVDTPVPRAATPTASAPGVISPDSAFRLGLRATLSGHTGPVNAVVFSSDGRIMVSGSADGTTKIWEATDGKELRTIKLTPVDDVRFVALSSSGDQLAAGAAKGSVRIFEVADGKELRNIVAHQAYLTGVALSPDGKTVASSSSDNSAKIWDVTSGKELFTFAGHPPVQIAVDKMSNGSVSSIALSPDGAILAIGNGGDFTVTLWEVASGKEMRTLTSQSAAGPMAALAFSRDGKLLASGSVGAALKLWEVNSGREMRNLKGHTVGSLRGLAFSPDGGVLASGGADRVIKLWDTTSGKELSMLTGHEGAVLSLAFSTDGKTLASASGDKTIKLWALPSP